MGKEKGKREEKRGKKNNDTRGYYSLTQEAAQFILALTGIVVVSGSLCELESCDVHEACAQIG